MWHVCVGFFLFLMHLFKVFHALSLLLFLNFEGWGVLNPLAICSMYPNTPPHTHTHMTSTSVPLVSYFSLAALFTYLFTYLAEMLESAPQLHSPRAKRKVVTLSTSLSLVF